jgi:hypothetical protein
MGVLGDLAVNLAAAGLGAVAVSVWHSLTTRRRYRGSRRFWRPFSSNKCLCVTGNISPLVLAEDLPSALDEAKRASIQEILPSLESYLGDQELSGLMGRGDHDAVVRLQVGLSRIGISVVIPEVTGRPSGDELANNLIVVGGPDVNWLTNALLERLPLKLTIVRNEIGRFVVRDLIHGQDYGPTSDKESGSVRDYGILVRAKNPFEADKDVMIMAGAHGFGSLAAAAVALQEEEALQRQLNGFPAGFECLVCHERDRVQGDAAQKNSIVIIRELRP